MEQPVTLIFLAIVLSVIVVNLAFAYGVSVDSVVLDDNRPPVTLAPRWAWVLATVLLGPVMAVLYWIVHRSRLVTPVLSGNDDSEAEDPLAEILAPQRKAAGKSSGRRDRK